MHNRIFGEHDYYQIWMLLATSSMLGVFVMAIVQSIKDLTTIRLNWQRKRIVQRVESEAKEFNKNPRNSPLNESDVKKALKDLVNLATGGHDIALYSLPIDQLAGQLGSACQVVLDYPGRYVELLKIVSCGAEAEDIQTLIEAPPIPTQVMLQLYFPQFRNFPPIAVERRCASLARRRA